MRWGLWILALSICLPRPGLQAQNAGHIVKDPYDLCSNPLLELRSLDLIELRQYETSGERVSLA